VGGAIVALHNTEIKTVLSLSYGTWVGDSTAPYRLCLFANRGDPIAPRGSTFLTSSIFGIHGYGVRGEEYFSCIYADKALQEHYKGSSSWDTKAKRLVIGPPNSAARKAAERDAGLARVAGGEKAQTYITYKNELVHLENSSYRVPIKQGFFVDSEGRAKPIVVNAIAANSTEKVVVCRYRSLTDRTPVGSPFTVLIKDLCVAMSGVDDIYTN
jgi:hypothetical protein